MSKNLAALFNQFVGREVPIVTTFHYGIPIYVIENPADPTVAEMESIARSNDLYLRWDWFGKIRSVSSRQPFDASKIVDVKIVEGRDHKWRIKL